MKENESVRGAAELFKALSSPARLALLIELERGPACVHELVQQSGASQSLVSQHLRVLRGAQLVRGDRRGKEVVYTLMDTHISALVADALAHVGEPPQPENVPVVDPEHHEHALSEHPTR
ncbi:metalloregulator ArsR/SmtB family transcription factor [Actinotalea sp. K2]|uniref:ArsR/SmtB family transcription factor n=1 Tax=Actinotalea sp. K2 TaxID=2939438 RepID=UPI0020183359|nr:metalloregulator ArsR/SmtB family transcription factor [Actinotalea sp. K2]MCL3859636.1 metalloregulator ArsR/SmtB family transcription factor [Actinotalea sp. K2]